VSIKVRVDFEDRSPEILRQVRAKTLEGLEEAGALVFAESQEAVPVDEGDLKASGKVEVDRQHFAARLIYGGIGARHAHLIEYGHQTKSGTVVPPQSFMRAPGKRAKPAVNAIMKRKLGEVK